MDNVVIIVKNDLPCMVKLHAYMEIESSVFLV